MAINYRDPRFQRALLSAHSDPIGTGIGAQKEITSKFVDQQQGVLTAFRNLQNNKMQFEANMRLANKRLDWRDKMFKKQLSQAKAESNLGIIGGLGTSLIAGLIGRDRRIKTEALAAKKEQQLDSLIKIMGGAKRWHSNYME
jgi:hypothetical protein